MIKRIILILTLIIVGGYLIYAFRIYDKFNKMQKCKDVVVEISNVDEKRFIDPEALKNQILKSPINPIGKALCEVNTLEIEKLVDGSNNYAKRINVFITNQDVVKVVIKEKKPVLRVIPPIGKDYYIDEDGNKLLVTDRYVTYIPVASGNIKENSEILGELYQFALFLQNDPFWNAQVNQIYVNKDEEIQFVTRVGNHLVTIGDTDNLEVKLDRLMTFYKKGLNKYGWNKYDKINLKFKNQVVCSKG